MTKYNIPNKTNANCHVFRMGFAYPVCIAHKYDYDQARLKLSESILGRPAQEHHYWSAGRLKNIWSDRGNARWYAGQRLWKNRENPRTDFWLVFRSEADRTLALMLLADA